MYFIGFCVLWVISAHILAMLINSMRVKAGTTRLNDGLSAFMGAYAWGPVGILGGLAPQAWAEGSAGPRIVGGIVGTIAAVTLYHMF